MFFIGDEILNLARDVVLKIILAADPLEVCRFNGRILLGFKLLNRLCISFFLDVFAVVYGW